MTIQLTKRHVQSLGDKQSAIDHLWRINWKQHGYPFCGLYAISPDNRWPTKIGISQNPVKRLIHLQNAHWRRLDIAEYGYCENFDVARRLEKKAHETLIADGKLLQGEWFDIRPEQGFEIVRFCADLLGIELRSDVPDDKIADAIEGFAFKLRSQEYIRLLSEGPWS